MIPLQSKAGTERTGLSTSPRARLRRWLDPHERLLYPTLADRGSVRATLEQAAPDAVLAYHWEALAALDGVHVAPKLGVAVDLSHLPHLYRWRAGLAAAARAIGAHARPPPGAAAEAARADGPLPPRLRSGGGLRRAPRRVAAPSRRRRTASTCGRRCRTRSAPRGAPSATACAASGRGSC